MISKRTQKNRYNYRLTRVVSKEEAAEIARGITVAVSGTAAAVSAESAQPSAPAAESAQPSGPADVASAAAAAECAPATSRPTPCRRNQAAFSPENPAASARSPVEPFLEGNHPLRLSPSTSNPKKSKKII